jgi:hypothetical protein
MTGKRYYITTRDAWQQHAGRFANSHWVELGSEFGRRVETGTLTSTGPEPHAAILVLVEGDEGAHLALEDDPAFEALPHPLGQRPISDSSQAHLAALGVAPGATTFDVAEAVARIHPLLRHRVF